MRKTGLYATGIFTLFILSCISPTDLFLDYHPVISLTGYLDSDYDTIVGNYYHPNTCSLSGDTVKMHLYSSDYKVGDFTNNGDQIRISIYTTDQDSFLENGDVFFHMLRSRAGSFSYNIAFGDTYNTSAAIIFHIQKFERRRGGRIEFDQVYIRTNSVDGRGGELEISKGRIQGKIQ